MKTFWAWFFKGAETKPGYQRLLDRWLIFHFFIGLLLAFLYQGKLLEAASTVMIPLSGVLVGLTFAWSGNALALLQSEEIHAMSERREGGFVEYVYTYQMAILIILFTLVVWGLAGLGGFRIGSFLGFYEKFALKSILFSLVSLSIRECWHVVLGAQMMLLAQKHIKDAKKKSNSKRVKVG